MGYVEDSTSVVANLIIITPSIITDISRASCSGSRPIKLGYVEIKTRIHLKQSNQSQLNWYTGCDWLVGSSVYKRDWVASDLVNILFGSIKQHQ
mgnify:CR=1 FL=1